MGMTMTEKILARASGARTVSPGDLVVTDVDTSVLIDNAFFPAYWREILKVHDPDKVIVVFDHRAPASDLVSAGAHVVGRKFVKQFGIKRFHDVGAHVGHLATSSSPTAAMRCRAPCSSAPIRTPAAAARSIARRAASARPT